MDFMTGPFLLIVSPPSISQVRVNKTLTNKYVLGLGCTDRRDMVPLY